MRSRIFQDNEDCHECSECEGILHHWIFASFPPGDEGDPDFLDGAQQWWEQHGQELSVCPIYWGCKHCTAWTPYDPEEHCCNCLGDLTTEVEQEFQTCHACIDKASKTFQG